MKIRTLLFILIPLLFLFNGLISFFLFKSVHQVNESYANLHKQLAVYDNIERTSRQAIDRADDLIIDRSQEQYTQLSLALEQLNLYMNQLDNDKLTIQAEAEHRSFIHIVHAFEQKMRSITDQQYVNTYQLTEVIDQAKQIASFIIDDSRNLISMQLTIHQQNFQEVSSEVDKLRIIGVIVLVSSTALCTWLAYSLSQSITKPISELVNTASHIASGNLNYSVASYPINSDFYALGHGFQHMQTELKRYIASEKEALHKDKLLKEMELELLKSQINPHFLFNSLNIVSKLALIEGAERTSDLTVAISNLLRYNLKNLDTAVPLRDEVKHARDYFYIQQARYRDRISFHTTISEEHLDTKLPVLTIQPIMENIFVHAIEQVESQTNIELTIDGNEHYTSITISDNGIGMDETTRLQLLQYDQDQTTVSSSHSTGLGTRNVFRRLLLLYGDQHAIDINSTLGKGTTITLQIPR